MKILQCISLSLLYLFFLLSCSGDMILSESDQFKIDGVEIQIYSDRFTVKNNRKSNLYYMSIDRDKEMHILWFPISTDENRITPGKKKSITFEDGILGRVEGNQINFHFWYRQKPKSGDMKLIMINPDTNKIEKIF